MCCCNSLQLQYGRLAECQRELQRQRPAVATEMDIIFSEGIEGVLRGL